MKGGQSNPCSLGPQHIEHRLEVVDAIASHTLRQDAQCALHLETGSLGNLHTLGAQSKSTTVEHLP